MYMALSIIEVGQRMIWQHVACGFRAIKAELLKSCSRQKLLWGAYHRRLFLV